MVTQSDENSDVALTVSCFTLTNLSQRSWLQESLASLVNQHTVHM